MSKSRASLSILLAVSLGSASFATSCAVPATAQESARARVAFRVEGMHCGACATRLSDALAGVEGVLAADVSFDETRAVVSYDPDRVTPARLVRVIEEAGFRAHIENR